MVTVRPGVGSFCVASQQPRRECDLQRGQAHKHRWDLIRRHVLDAGSIGYYDGCPVHHILLHGHLTSCRFFQSAWQARSPRQLAQPSHVCTGSMPRTADFAIDYRPRLFDEFDNLIHELSRIVPCVVTRAEIKAALEVEGRQLDVDQLAVDLHLKPRVLELVRGLSEFGDDGGQVHAFASVILARMLNCPTSLGRVKSKVESIVRDLDARTQQSGLRRIDEPRVPGLHIMSPRNEWIPLTPEGITLQRRLRQSYDEFVEIAVFLLRSVASILLQGEHERM